MKFEKPYKNCEEQLDRLQEKAMIIDVPRAEALAVLSSITYYRFSGYALPFLDKDVDSYTDEIKFSDIVALYCFDARLRDHFSDALCAIEVTLRAIVSNEFAALYGPLGYLDANNFVDTKGHASTIAKLSNEFNRSKQPCAAHFRAEYDNPPIWAICDVMTFGSISMLLKILKKADQNAISTHYGMRGDILASYMQHATVLRNLCAHHCRLIDFPYSNLKAPPQEYIFRPLNVWKKTGVEVRKDRPLLYQAALIYHLLAPTSKNVLNRDEWKDALCEMFDQLPSSIARRVRCYIDFPENAVNSPLW